MSEMGAREAQELAGQLNALAQQLERYPDPEIREKALDLIQLILKLYGEGLRRILAALDSLSLKDEMLSRLAQDEVVRALLLIHGLLPAAEVEPERAGPASAGATPFAPGRAAAAHVAKLVRIGAAPQASGRWLSIIRTVDLEPERLRIVSFGEFNLIVCNIGGAFYAYRNGCAAGKRPLDDALFESPMLTCSCHGYRYDLRREGACMEMPGLRLEMLPVAVQDNVVKVAV